ncbi:DUF1488 family protein [Pigmentiphaga sp.]|uniref:DUF1488 family protein n=1 Tax=Pigmentiphaga sp. TaxID=1977564 RepID=UPI00128B89D8|nr:DUF1488 family protein [Pigmentiphaga sp.]MPS28888.1 DUF1488 family protein [Alcaligenaceae bacterium SAGV5]MPS52642.1 DUF1488 family protein [Alcaligenaceae bacterium SAGV3]MPT60455.1 DUF1488 family protein [Alcaligenaceae bacterium]
MTTELAREVRPAVLDGAVRFTARFEGRKSQEFEISADVLCEHFGALDMSADALLAAFHRGRHEILTAAAETAGTPTSGIVQLGTGDFRA